MDRPSVYGYIALYLWRDIVSNYALIPLDQNEGTPENSFYFRRSLHFGLKYNCASAMDKFA